MYHSGRVDDGLNVIIAAQIAPGTTSGAFPSSLAPSPQSCSATIQLPMLKRSGFLFVRVCRGSYAVKLWGVGDCF